MGYTYTYTYTDADAEFRNDFSSSFGEWGDVARGDQLPYLPEHALNLRAGVEGGRWRVNLACNYIDAMRTEAGQGPVGFDERTGSAFVMDLSASYDLTQAAHLFARVESLADETWIASRRPTRVRPGSPRMTFVGMRVRF